MNKEDIQLLLEVQYAKTKAELDKEIECPNPHYGRLSRLAGLLEEVTLAKGRLMTTVSNPSVHQTIRVVGSANEPDDVLRIDIDYVEGELHSWRVR